MTATEGQLRMQIAEGGGASERRSLGFPPASTKISSKLRKAEGRGHPSGGDLTLKCQS